MPWRVSRVLDFRSHCTSVHAHEADAKLDTGRQLGALLEKLAADLPNYATHWDYPAAHPGFVEDAAETLDVAGDLLASDRVWESYDVWQAFMNRWEGQLNPPLWAQIGTVVVDGKGPTVKSSYNPGQLKAGCHTRKVEPKDVAAITRDLIRTMAASAEAQINLEMALENREVPREAVEQVIKGIVLPELKKIASSQEALDYFMANIASLQQRIEDAIRKELGLEPGGIERLLKKYGPPPEPPQMGAWRVSRATTSGPLHASIHAKEEPAAEETAEGLQSTIAAILASGLTTPEMESMVDAVQGRLRQGDVWGAYELYRELEDEAQEFYNMPPFRLWGGVRVEVV